MKQLFLITLMMLSVDAFGDCAGDLTANRCNSNGYCFQYVGSAFEAQYYCNYFSRAIECGKSQMATKYNISTGQLVQKASSFDSALGLCGVNTNQTVGYGSSSGKVDKGSTSYQPVAPAKLCKISWETTRDNASSRISIRLFTENGFSDFDDVLFKGNILFPRIITEDGGSRPVHLNPKDEEPELYRNALREAQNACLEICKSECQWK